MTDSHAHLLKRPGGLTAIAVLCLVFAAIGMLAGFALRAVHADGGGGDEVVREFERESARQRDAQGMTGAQRAMNETMVKGMAEKMRNASPQAFRAMFAAGMAGGVLMFVAGIGLLAQRRVLGYHAAIASAVAVVACGVIAMTQLGFMYWGFPMIGAVWAFVLGLIVHFMYRPHLVR